MYLLLLPSSMVLLFGMPNMGEMIFLVVIILLLFGGKKLPELARGLGAGIHEFRRGMNGAGNPQTEAQEHVPERDVTPPTHEKQDHHVEALPEPKARGGRPSVRLSAGPKKVAAQRKPAATKGRAKKK